MVETDWDLKDPSSVPLPLPGLDIRTELKGVFLSFFGLNLAVFIFLFSAWTMWFWSILAEKAWFGRIWSGIRTRDLWRDSDECYRFD